MFSQIDRALRNVNFQAIINLNSLLYGKTIIRPKTNHQTILKRSEISKDGTQPPEALPLLAEFTQGLFNGTNLKVNACIWMMETWRMIIKLLLKDLKQIVSS